MGAAEIRDPGRGSGKTKSHLSSHKKEEFAAHFFETVREPLLALDAELRVWMANKSFYKSFEVTPEETQGRLIYELGNGQWNIPELRKLLEEIVPENECFADFEVVHQFEHIGRKNMLLNARRINNGRLILLAIEDVTERKRMENELRSFAHLASHDLKEPLRTVTSFLTLLKRQPDRHDEKSEKYVEIALEGAQRMRDLIENMLAHSSAGREKKHDPVDLNSVLQNVLNNLNLSFSEAKVEFSTDDLPTVAGDASELEQLFQNLISNAIKYKSEESPRISLSAARAGTAWLFRLEDNGIGITAANRTRVFNAFERLHSRTKYPGTGLGLSICKKIVENYGGRIWIESSAGHGSVFCFTLPTQIPYSMKH